MRATIVHRDSFGGHQRPSLRRSLTVSYRLPAQYPPAPARVLSQLYVHLLPSDQLEPDYLDGLLGAEGVTEVSLRPAENVRDATAIADGEKAPIATIS